MLSLWKKYQVIPCCQVEFAMEGEITTTPLLPKETKHCTLHCHMPQRGHGQVTSGSGEGVVLLNGTAYKLTPALCFGPTDAVNQHLALIHGIQLSFLKASR